MAPTLTFGHWGNDGGDLIAAARVLGIPHPPGYPTYTLLAWLALHLPVGAMAFRVNLLSALCCTCAIGLLCLTAQALSSERVGRLTAGIAGLTLGFAPLVWSHAIIAEVYAPALCAASLSLYLAIQWRNGGRDALLWLAALVLGLGLGIHLTLAFAILPAIVLLWPQRQRWLRWQTLVPTATLFLAGLAVFGYLPVAASRRPPVNWGDPRQWDRFLWVVSAELYRPLAFGLPAADMGPRLTAWAGILSTQLAWFGWPVILLGLLRTCHTDRALGAAGMLWLGTALLFAFLYNSTDSIVYLLPALLIPSLWLCEGAAYLLQFSNRTHRWASAAAAALLLLIPFLSLARQWQKVDLSHNRSASLYVDRVLDAMEPFGLALVQGDGATFSLWYATFAEERRHDVAIVNTSLLGFDWYRSQLRQAYPQLQVPEPTQEWESAPDLIRETIVRNYGSRPVYALDPSTEWREWFDIAQVEDAPLYRIRPRARWEMAR